MAERQRVASKEYDVEKGSVTFHIFERPLRMVKGPDGNEKPAIKGSHTFVVSKFPETVQRRLQLHGLGQKAGDTYADASTPDEILVGLREMDRQLTAGTWSDRGEGGPKTPPILIQALARVYKYTVEEAQERWNSKSKEDQGFLRKAAKVQEAVNAITEEKAAAKRKELKKAAAAEEAMEF